MNQKDRAAARQLYGMVRGMDEKGAAEAIAAFVGLLAANGRLDRGPKILDALETAAVEAEGGLEAELTTAAAIDEAEARKIGKELAKALDAPVALRRKTDPSLIGGAVIRAGDLLIDASVKRRLETLKHRLAE